MAKGKRFYLFIAWYDIKDPERLKEHVECLNKNIENSLIKNIYIIFEYLQKGKLSYYKEKYSKILGHEKIKLAFKFRKKSRTISYYNFIRLANKSLAPGSIFIIANADIYFDDTLSKAESFNFDNTVFALTRYNVREEFKDMKGNKWVPKYWSQDSWFMKTPFPENEDFRINLGWVACDNVIAYNLYQAGFNVLNPSKSINSWHLHKHDVTSTLSSTGHSYGFTKPHYWLARIKLDEIEKQDLNRVILLSQMVINRIKNETKNDYKISHSIKETTNKEYNMELKVAKPKYLPIIHGEERENYIRKHNSSIVVAGLGRCGTTLVFDAIRKYGFPHSRVFIDKFQKMSFYKPGMVYKSHDHPPTKLPDNVKVIWMFGNPMNIILSTHKMINEWGRKHYYHLGLDSYVDNDFVFNGDNMNMKVHFEEWYKHQNFEFLSVRYESLNKREAQVAIWEYLGFEFPFPQLRERETDWNNHYMRDQLYETYNELNNRIESVDDFKLWSIKKNYIDDTL